MGQQNRKYLSRSELAEYLGVSKSFVDKAMLYDHAKLPPFVRITDRIVRFPTDLLAEWEARQLENVQVNSMKSNGEKR